MNVGRRKGHHREQLKGLLRGNLGDLFKESLKLTAPRPTYPRITPPCAAAGQRQPAWAHRRTRGTYSTMSAAGHSARGGGAEPFPLRPGVTRHLFPFRRDRGCVSSFSVSSHSAGPTQFQTTARRTSS